MGVPSEKFDAALSDMDDALQALNDHLEWAVDDPFVEDNAAHCLLGIRALLARLREVTGR